MPNVLNLIKDSAQRIRAMEQQQIISPLVPADIFQFVIAKITVLTGTTSLGNNIYSANPVNPWNGEVSTETMVNIEIPNQFSFYTGDYVILGKTTGQFVMGINIGTFKITENGYGLYVSSP